MWYTLKDATDRGRLAASTFRLLNLAMALVAAMQLWGLWQMVYLVSATRVLSRMPAKLQDPLHTPACSVSFVETPLLC